jgi:NADH-quinone oxidoreductase subunit L
VNGPVLEAQPFYWQSMVITLLATAIGLAVGWMVYVRRVPAPESLTASAPGAYRFLVNRYYVDDLYEFMFVRPVKWTSRQVNRYFEQDVVDYTVDGVARLVRFSSGRLRYVQTGFVRNYALGILFGAVLVVGYYVVGGR